MKSPILFIEILFKVMRKEACHVHWSRLKAGQAPIHFGMVLSNESRLQAQKQFFPYGCSFVPGGCVIRDRDMQDVRFCPECRQAEQQWQKDHAWQPDDERICSVHQCALVVGEAEIRYGYQMALITYPLPQDLFPYVCSSVPGGCVVREKHVREVWFCPMCRQAKQEWLQDPEKQQEWQQKAREWQQARNREIPCQVHWCKLVEGEAQVRYGKIPSEELRAGRKLFPRARSYVPGGSVVRKESTQEVLYCPKCRQAEQKWLKRQERTSKK